MSASRVPIELDGEPYEAAVAVASSTGQSPVQLVENAVRVYLQGLSSVLSRVRQPTPKLYELAERAAVALGGCSISPGDRRWRCVECLHQWGVADQRGSRETLLRFPDSVVGRDRVTGFLNSRPCNLYTAGHTPHWIQVLSKSVGDGRPPVEANVRRALGVQVIVELEDALVVFLNHDVGRLVEMLTRYGTSVLIDEGRSLLQVPTPTGAYCFSITRNYKSWRTCSPRPRSRGPRGTLSQHDIPEGLQRCERCGEYNGVAKEGCSTCRCFGHPCRYCGVRLIHEPISDYWDREDERWTHVPHFGWGIHCPTCRSRSN